MTFKANIYDIPNQMAYDACDDRTKEDEGYEPPYNPDDYDDIPKTNRKG